MKLKIIFMIIILNAFGIIICYGMTLLKQIEILLYDVLSIIWKKSILVLLSLTNGNVYYDANFKGHLRRV